MRLCDRHNWRKPCPEICGEMCDVWNTEDCLFSESKRGWYCEQCWTHSIPDSEVDPYTDQCPVCETSEFFFPPDDRFNVAAWCGGTGTRWAVILANDGEVYSVPRAVDGGAING